MIKATKTFHVKPATGRELESSTDRATAGFGTDRRQSCVRAVLTSVLLYDIPSIAGDFLPDELKTNQTGFLLPVVDRRRCCLAVFI